ncbi:MAG: hypothetical protein KA515_00135 [Candidatus Pacebacteria bacterium]|nr:hypothetical protein [Candidatus Paceibacterota bacterium]
MIELRDLLSKWNNSLFSKEYQKEAIREAILSVVGVRIKNEDIEVKNNIIYLNIKPIYKNEILIKKDKIDAFFSNTLNTNKTQEIR